MITLVVVAGCVVALLLVAVVVAEASAVLQCEIQGGTKPDENPGQPPGPNGLDNY